MKARILLIESSLLMACTGCSQPESMMRPGGPAAGNLSQVGWVIFILFGVVAFIMWVLLAWAVSRKRGTLMWHAPWNEGGGQRWILIGGFAIPLVVLCGVFVFALERMTQFPLHDMGHMNPEIEVVAHQWWWELHYIGNGVDKELTSANEIHIPVGRPVDLVLRTADVVHSFWVPALHGKVEFIPGQPNYIRIQASRPGRYEGQCSEYCGEEHARMRLLVVAQTPAEYDAWMQGQLKPAALPQDAEAMHGQEVFEQAACALCHTVRGTIAMGKVAPDLTHLASREGIAANSYKNNQANLEAWVTHAQSLKPGATMPDLTQFTGTDLRALVAYLRELK
jgi:cytochrome c oxidase subunit 2